MDCAGRNLRSVGRKVNAQVRHGIGDAAGEEVREDSAKQKRKQAANDALQ